MSDATEPRATDLFDALREQFRVTFDVAWSIRASVVMALIASVALYLPDQVRESYRILADGEPWVRHLRFAGLLLALAYLSVQLWSAGRLAIYLVPTAGRFSPRPDGAWRRALERRLPRVVALVPVLAAAAGLHEAALGVPAADTTGASAYLDRLAIAALILAAGLYAAYALRRKLMFGDETRPDRVRGLASLHRATRRMMLTLAVLAAMTLGVASALPLLYADQVTTPSLIALWAGSVAWLLQAVTWLAARTRLPVLTALLAVPVVLSVLNLNDNHALRMAAERPPAADPPASAGGLWPELRRDAEAWRLARTPETPPRLVLVAAEGGGIRAAYMTALALTTLADACPALATHLFAISGVSGGSVGAAVAAAALAAQPPAPNGGSCLDAVAAVGPEPMPDGLAQLADATLRADLIEAAFTGMLHGDAFARWVPLDRFDRARTLEDALVRAWRTSGVADPGRDLFTAGLSSLWAPDGNVPGLLLNTTAVETGHRVVASNVGRPSARMLVEGRACWRERPCLLEDLAPGIDPTLVAAAFASARFPLVTPVATVTTDARDCTPSERPDAAVRPCRLVDGGYFENSGTETVMDALLALEGWLLAQRGQVLVIRITNSEATTSLGGPAPERPWSKGGMNELASPIRAMLATRSARGQLAERRLDALSFELWRDRVQVVHLRMGPGDVEVPLGWSLSEAARREIRNQLFGGSPRACLDREAMGAQARNRDALVTLGAFVDGVAPTRCGASSTGAAG